MLTRRAEHGRVPPLVPSPHGTTRKGASCASGRDPDREPWQASPPCCSRLAALVGLATPAHAAAAASTATATYAKTQDWGTGFEGKWTVKNTGTTALSSWTVEWDFPAGTMVTSAWDATVTNSADHWTAKNVSWNGSLAPGASVSFGFNGSGPGTPSGCKLNGASCDGGDVPGDDAPSAPGTPTASSVTDTSVKLAWTAATDDKGIKNYDVLRDGTKVATVTGDLVLRHRAHRRHRLLVHRPGP